jgi:non-homologous end joining protein Ku
MMVPGRFAVIREAMRDKKVVGVGKVVVSKREHPATEVFTPFGSGYVAEAHGSAHLGYEPKNLALGG